MSDTQKPISVQLEHVIMQLLPLVDRMRAIDSDPHPPIHHADLAAVRDLVAASHRKLLGVDASEEGKKAIESFAEALYEALQLWNNGARAGAALTRAEARRGAVVALLPQAPSTA